MFKGLDHVAIVVPDTEAALRLWGEKLGLPVLYTETVQDGRLRLTHLALGNTELQLVQPLVEDHPLSAWLKAHGPGLHHLCLAVDDLGQAMKALPSRRLSPASPIPHQGTQGRRAVFLDMLGTDGVRVELTGT
jgi:methylmalonyl-CoA/ethylmalonyl-CoA epimerase